MQDVSNNSISDMFVGVSCVAARRRVASQTAGVGTYAQLSLVSSGAACLPALTISCRFQDCRCERRERSVLPDSSRERSVSTDFCSCNIQHKRRQGGIQGKSPCLEMRIIVIENDAISEGRSIFSNNITKIVENTIFQLHFNQNFLKISQQCIFDQTCEKLTQVFKSLLKNRLRNWLKIFESSPSSMGNAPTPDPLQGQPAKCSP